MPLQNVDDPFALTPVQQSVTAVVLPNDVGSGLSIDKDQAEIERLYSTSMEYARNIAHWDFCLKAYEGGPHYVKADTLFKHMRESDESYKDRLKRAVYLNYCAGLVDFIPDFVFSTPVNRVADASVRAEFDKFEQDVDRCGTHIDQFWRTIAEEARIFGMCWVGVDKPSVPEEEQGRRLSKQRATQLGIDMPYFFKVRPTEVLDLIADALGRPVYFKRIARHRTFDSATHRVREIDTFYEWTLADVTISEVDVTDPNKKILSRDVRTQINTWGEVPFVPLYHKRSKVDQHYGTSFLQDIAYQNRSVFNLTSQLEEFLSRQGFSFLAVESSSMVPMRGDTSRDVGTSNVMEVPAGTQHMPQYIAPPVDPAQFIQSERANLIVEMFRTAAQDLSTQFAGVSSDTASGDAIRQKFGRTVPVIARLADSLHQAEESALRMWALMQNKEWKGKVVYRSDYSSQSLMSMVLEMSAILNNLKVLSPTFIREEWLRIVREADGRISRDAMEKIIAEINAIPNEELVGLYRGEERPASEGAPAMADLIQGAEQAEVGTDAGRTALRGDLAAVKELLPDRQKRGGPAGQAVSRTGSD